MLLREQVMTTQRQVASLEEQSPYADPHRDEQVKELQGQLETLQAKMQRMERLEKSFSATKRKLEVKGTSFDIRNTHYIYLFCYWTHFLRG